jgi:hypothetical protein
MIKMGMWKCWTSGVFAVTGVPRLQVHDELDFNDNGQANEAFREMAHIMETCIPLKVPVRMECEIGPNWGETQPVTV